MGDYRTVDKPLEWFKGNPENYRSHPQQQQAVLQESLRRFGVFRNVVARPDGTILAGHGILAAAAAEGHKSFPCVIFTGTDEEARALMVADNEQARLAEDDEGKLAELLESIADSDVGVSVTGWTGDEIEALLDLSGSEFSQEQQDLSGTAETLAGRYLVAVAVDAETHQALQTLIEQEQLPGESTKETFARMFPAMVQSRQK